MKQTDPLHSALEDVATPLRGATGLARLILSVAAAIAILGLVAWWARVSQAELVASVLWTWLVVLAVLVGGAVLALRKMRIMGTRWTAAQLEELGAWRRGALLNVIDPVVEGTSHQLRAAAVANRVTEIRDRGDAVIAPVLAGVRRGVRLAFAGVAVAAVVLISARPLEGTAARLWDPMGAWTALTAPVRLVARDPSVARGETATFDLVAIGHRAATLFTRMPGEPWRSTAVALDAEGKGEFVTAPLNAELVARLEAGGHSSEEVRVGVRLPAFLGSFVVTAHYPEYLGLEAETLPLGGDTLLIPQGTRLELNGRATVPLASVQLDGPQGSAPLTVEGLAFHGSLVPSSTGVWRVVVKPEGAEALDGDVPTIPVRVLPDSAPVVEVPVPGVDTIAGPSLQVGLLISLHDDHGLSGAALELRHGAAGAITRIALDVGRGNPDRALLSNTLDLAALKLQPGDTLHYTVVATDNSPSRKRGTSRSFWIRVPTEAELRAAKSAVTAETAAGFDSLASAAARLQRQTEDLAKERARVDANSSGNGDPEPMTADAARKAEAVAKAQEQLQKDAKKMERAVDDLRRAAEQQGLADSAFAAQLDELRRLMKLADSPELRDALAALQQALKQLDPEATRNAMQMLAQKQAEFESAMKQARDLFKRAAMESDLSNLSQEAKSLAQQQQDLTPKLEKAAQQRQDSIKTPLDPASAKAIADEKALAAKADSLAASIDRAAQKMPSDSVRDGLKQAAEQARNASQQMQDAAQDAQQGKPKQAGEKAKAAMDQMSAVDKAVQAEKKELQETMKEEVLLALDRALAEATRLVQREMELIEDFRRGGTLVSTRAEQSLVDDGVGRLLAQVNVIGGKNALVPQQIAIALAASRVNMRNAVEAVSSLSPDLNTASNEAGQAVDALAFAAYGMLRAKDRVGNAESGSGMEEAISEMKSAAEQQGKAAQSAGQQMQAGETGPEQLMQMAMQQQAVARQLERLRASGQMPGAGEMMKEAKDIAREIESGQLNKETVDRQNKLYKKMLDAGRQLQGEEDDDEKQRKAEVAKDGQVLIPAALDPRLRQGATGLKLPSWDTLQKLTPDERRRVLEYFQRLSEIKRP